MNNTKHYKEVDNGTVRCNKCYNIYNADIDVCPECLTDKYLMQPYMEEIMEPVKQKTKSLTLKFDWFCIVLATIGFLTKTSIFIWIAVWFYAIVLIIGFLSFVVTLLVLKLSDRLKNVAVDVTCEHCGKKTKAKFNVK